MENKHAAYDLKQMQSLPLEAKIEMSKRRIKEWYEYWDGNVYVSFSGGKDSTVLLHLVREIYPDVVGVFVDTGLEYPEIRKFVKTFENIETIRPKINFVNVITEYGYPIISKEVSENLYYAMKGANWAQNRLMGLNPDGSSSEFKQRFIKWGFLKSAPFKISHKCCSIMKKQPCKNYEHKTGFHPYLGTMATESSLRKKAWEKNGCNAFNGSRPISAPLSFWTEQDVLKYLTRSKLDISTIYGNIVKDCDLFKLTGVSRTGCMFCMYGCHLEKEPNRFQKMKISHPKQYDYCMRDVEDGGLGLRKVLEYIGVKYE